uniref:Uncharacterized protein n=1 Tax=Saimiri boliviensis boliviensis TaxID=39432 RepID=A0A2K6SMZ4_SAIBB
LKVVGNYRANAAPSYTEFRFSVLHLQLLFIHSCFTMLVVTLPTCLFTLKSRLMKKSLHGICCSHGQGEANGLVKTHQAL